MLHFHMIGASYDTHDSFLKVAFHRMLSVISVLAGLPVGNYQRKANSVNFKKGPAKIPLAHPKVNGVPAAKSSHSLYAKHNSSTHSSIHNQSHNLSAEVKRLCCVNLTNTGHQLCRLESCALYNHHQP